MKDLYIAVRNLIFPQQDSTRNTGKNFARGITKGSADYPPGLRELLLKFEQLNRGHRDMLQHPTLNVYASDTFLNHSPRRADTIRGTLGESLSELFQYVVAATILPETPDFDAVLDAPDELGYVTALLKFGLRSLCEVEAFTAKTAFDIERLRLEQDGRQAVLHVRISVGTKHATRAIKLGQANISTLRGARQTQEAASDMLESWFRDVSLWDEFAEATSVRTTVPQPAMPAAVAAEPAPGAPAALAHAAPNADALPTTSAVPVHPEAPALPHDSEAALLARLQRDLRGFLDVYSPHTRAFMEQHWGAFRSIVTEPEPN